MASTYLAGVFLTIYTYDGPQLVYHYYDPKHVVNIKRQDATSDDVRFDWSEDDFSEDEHSPSVSTLSSRVSLAASPTTQAIQINNSINSQHGTSISSSGSPGSSLAGSKSDIIGSSGPTNSLPAGSMKSAGSSLLSQGLKTAALNVPQTVPMPINEPVVASSVAMANNLSNSSTSDSLANNSSLFPAIEENTSYEGNAVTPVQKTSVNNEMSSASKETLKDGENASIVASVSSTGTNDKQQTQQYHHRQSSEQDQLEIGKFINATTAPVMPAGLDRDMLAEILCPPESMCNEKFSLTVDNCTFVGIPVHILESGTWKPSKKSYQEQLEKSVTEEVKSDNAEVSKSPERSASKSQESETNFCLVDEESTDENKIEEPSSVEISSLKSNDEEQSKETEQTDVNSKTIPGVITEKDSPMRMFHVSFAILPPITEASDCEERLYKSISVPFIRLSRQEQASKNYVWSEVSKISKAQEATSHLRIPDQQAAIESASELATSLRKMYMAISKLDIARIMIANKPRAFQIPLQLELTHLPTWLDDVSPYAYVSTSNSSEKEITHDVYTCYGSLLLDDPEVIVEEIDVDPNGPVAAMIRNIDPTSSLVELSRQNNIEISQIVSLVWSSVYWRRARIIIPLHSRFTYTVSPMAPRGERFHALSKAFNSIFPMMPPIQRLLGLLSTGKPKPFATHIPTNDHRHIYMQSLAWSLQNDFIVHLPTFALIVVTKKIKLSAHNYEDIVHNSAIVEDRVETEEPKTKQTGVERPAKITSRSHTYRIDPEDIHDSVILDPRTASTMEKRWLGQVMMSGATRNPDQAALFQRLTKYFNGKDCLEQVMIHEKITREDMRTFLQEFSQYIVTYKHW